MARAVLEGVAFGLRDGLELMVEAGVARPTRLRVSGGGTASPLWRQILADVLGVEIATVETTEGAAYGAALLAAVGAEWFDDVDAATQAVVRISARESPGAAAAAYEAGHRVFRDLYPALAPLFPRM
jgi:xylulokinase